MEGYLMNEQAMQKSKMQLSMSHDVKIDDSFFLRVAQNACLV